VQQDFRDGAKNQAQGRKNVLATVFHM
jgi:hypothetical protein